MTHSSSPASELIGKTIGGRFVIERVLGEGGMGAVFAARELPTSGRVALKIIHADLAAARKEHVQRFLQETLAAALVNHPNVVQSLGAFNDETGRPVLVLELLDGESLDRVIRRGPLPIPRALEIAIAASQGIAAAHAKGIVHRDLKPANIFLANASDGELQVKVLDFGVALLHDPLREPGSTQHTDHGVLLGTLDYMSPEQLQDPRAVDERSDVYALGVILFEMVTGRAPFRAETDPMLVVQILSSPPADIRQYRPDTSEAFARVIERALTKKPADRFQNMTEFSAALVEVARTSLRNERPRAGSKAKLAGWIVLALVVAVALALTFRR